MVDKLGDWARTDTCGQLRADDAGRDVLLLGWVHKVRDLGHLVFVDLRDRHGLTQVVFEAGDLRDRAKHLRAEFVIGVKGRVRPRAAEAQNAKMPTGAVEVEAAELKVFSEAKVPPFVVADDVAASDELRLRYRYLDLRRPALQANLGLRHRVTMAVRRYFDHEGFWEIETPVLTKSTPEGARDYLVPSRVHPGEFYALPQSPQIFKQILMIAGTDRYFQIVKCFRDEDLRADRQPEFTQIDVEMSFATREIVFAIIEPLIREIFAVDRPGRSRVAVPAPVVRRRDRALRVGQARPARRHGHHGRLGRVRGLDLRRVPRGRRRGRRGARHRRARRRRRFAQGARQRSPTRRSRRAPAAWSGCARAAARCRVRRSRRPAKPRSARRSRRPAPGRPTSCCWRAARRTRPRRCSANPPVGGAGAAAGSRPTSSRSRG